jgi:type I restriction enzyme S subunit
MIQLYSYPKYRDSGQQWIGHVPSHWEVLPNRALFKERIAKGHDDEQMLSVTIKRGVIRQADLLRDTSKKDSSNENKGNYKLALPGDIAYNKMRAWQGAVGFSSFRGIVSPAYIIETLRGPDNPEFFHYVMRTPAFATEAERWSYGITSDQWSLRSSDFKQIYCQRPSRDEQDAIVRFLKQSEKHINRLIRAKRRVIELLNEQKQAIIQRAVTRGLDPNVSLKPSGIEWLGEIPEHWQLARIRRFVSHVEQGWSPVAAEGSLEQDQYAVLTLSSIRRGTFHSTAIKPIEKDATIPLQMEVHDGDFLLSRSNTRERVGDVCIVEGVRPKTIICDLIYRLTLKGEVINSRFLSLALLSPIGRRQIESDARGSSGTMPKLSQGHIKSWKVPLPSLREQEAIVNKVKEKTVDLDETISSSEREIALLREYRTRIIADVVTGKLDVREVELPELNDVGEVIDVEDEELEDSEELVAVEESTDAD